MRPRYFDASGNEVAPPKPLEPEERIAIALERIADALEAQTKAMVAGQQAAIDGVEKMFQVGHDLAAAGAKRPIIIGDLPAARPGGPPVCMMCKGPLDGFGLCPQCLPEENRPPELRVPIKQ